MLDKSRFRDLYQASLELLKATSFEEANKYVVDWAIKLVGAKYGSIFEYSNSTPHRIYTSYPKLSTIKPRKRGDTYNAYKTTTPFIRHIAETAKVQPDLLKFKIGSDITVPLNYGGEKFGALSVLSHEKDVFNQSDLHVMNFLTPLASFSIRQQKLKNKIRDALYERDLFISMAAHEIKTPLTSITMYTQIIKTYIEKSQIPQFHIVDKINTETRRLNNLVSTFLNIQQIKSLTIDYKFNKINVLEVVKDAIEDFKLNFPNHIVKLVSKNKSEKYLVSGDKVRVQQAIYNILKNAGKYSEEKSEVKVVVTKSKKHINVAIIDQGLGISNKDLKHLFKKYFRGKSTKTSGMGLGLFLTKNIVYSHQGKIIVKSKKGVGTKVLIKLPNYASRNRKGERPTRNFH